MGIQAEAGKEIKTDSQTVDPAPAAPQPVASPDPAAQPETVAPEVKAILEGAISAGDGGETAAPEKADAHEGAGDGASNPEGDAPPAEYDLEIPEGFQVNEESMGAFKALAGKHKLPPEAVKEIFSIYTKEAEGARDAFQKQYVEALTVEHNEGLKAIKADPEFGGTQYKESQRYVGLALKKYGDDDFVASIKRRVMGNDPALFRFLARVGKPLDEPGPVASNAFTPEKPKSREEAMFPGYNP